ncbi:N-acetylmuramoyl-L-alanine amidase [Archangium sp.]|uniref:N-acetylmuramoyl-L-alanine amidase n=1 Tax=Archangium sp. TaxID=1872627 RepID=UPI00286ADBC3|nr:N-acetylmuramoyl-L-alanine amidase [Archangium sp.]
MPHLEYRIKPGDTLAAIARSYNVTLDVLARHNGISNPNRIQSGQLLRIPAAAGSSGSTSRPLTHKVSAGETLSSIAASYELTVETLAQANNLRDVNRLFIGQVLKLQSTPSASTGQTLNTRSGPPPQQQVTSGTLPQQHTTPLPASGSPPSIHDIMEVAFRITGAFEGGRATSYQNEDSGIVSYGKHQATLSSGTLGTILAKYVKRSTNPAAQRLAGFMDRVNRKDSSLRKDAGFKQALLDAGADPVMSVIQDEVFAQKYWPTAEQGTQSDKLKSPLALAMYYDTNIQGGLAAVRTATAKAMKGKPFSELAYLTEFNRQRDLRLQGLAEDKRSAARYKWGEEKEQLLNDAKWLDSSRSRVVALQSLVAAGDLQLRGDAQGLLHLNRYRVRGLSAGGASTTQPQQPAPTSPPRADAATLVKPPVVSKPSPNFGSRNGTDIDAIILHHTASNNVEADLRTLTKPSSKVSAHYLIGPDGTMYQLVQDEMKAWHAGESAIRGQKKPGVNSRSIGIEITNDGLGRTPFTEAQYQALEKLVPYLVRAYKVPMENLLGHRDVAPGRKIDPANNFDWSRVRRAVEASTGGTVATGPQDNNTGNASTPTPRKWSLSPSLDDVLKKGAVLKEGMQGPAVSELQRLLGLESPDGKFGSNTKLVVKTFNASAGVKMPPGLEGTATKATFEALKKKSPPNPIAGDVIAKAGVNLPEIARNVHAAMQGGLTSLGTNEEQVYTNLARLNHDAKLITEFKKVYAKTYKVDIVEELKSEFSNTWLYGDELNKALSYLSPRSSPPPKKTNPPAPITPGNKTPSPSPSPGGAKERSGKEWVNRFLPSNKVSDLKEPFQSKVRNFLTALTAGGVKYDINTTLRPPQRSYLMYYAREVASGRLAPDKVPAFIPQNNDAPVNIDWAHRDAQGKADLTAAKKAAVAMDKEYNAAKAIGKPYKSNHNGGEAIDMDFAPAWGIGKSVVDATGKTVTIRSKRDLLVVGATFGVYHWNYHGPKNKTDDPHWSKTGN